MVTTGDLISNMGTTTAMEAKMFLSAFNSFYYAQNSIPSFFCTGNHDQNMLTDNISYHFPLSYIQSSYPEPHGSCLYEANDIF